MRQRIQAKPKSAAIVAGEFYEKVALYRDRERLLHFYVDVHRKAAGLPRKIVGVALARALMLAIEEVTEGYRGYRGSLIRETWDSDWIVGDDRISLAWDESNLPALEKAFADQALLARIDGEMNGYGSVIAVGRDAQATKGTIVFRSPYRFDPDRYCKANGLKSTLLKTDKGAYRYDFSKESLKKKIIEGMSVAQSEREWSVTVRPGPKFRAEKFVKDVFELPYQEAWVTVAVCAVFAG